MFALDPGERVDSHSVSPKPPVDKTFRLFAPEQWFLPPSLEDWLPAGQLVRFIADLVDEHLDMSRIQAAYTEVRGGPPYDPRQVLTTPGNAISTQTR